MPERLRPRFASRVALYEGALALLGWVGLARLTWTARPLPAVLPVLLYLLLAIALKREGIRIARLVTHSLAGVAVLAALIALGPAGGAWVAAVSGLLILAARNPGSGSRGALARWRLAFFGGGLNALLAIAGAWLYGALGGRHAPEVLLASDLPPVLALGLAWFLGDHLGWSARIALEEGSAGLRQFLRTIGLYSLTVELFPLPLAAVVAVSYDGPGLLAFGLLAAFLVASGEVVRRLNEALARARARVADLTTFNAFSRALLASKLDVTELCHLLCAHTTAVVPAPDLWLGLFDARGERLETCLAADGPAAGGSEPEPGLLGWMRGHQAPLLVRDARLEDLPFAATPEKPRFRSALFVPLLAEGRLIGLLAVRSPAPGAYGEDALRTVATFANQAAIAIQNARSFEAEQRRARQLAAVGEVSRRVAAILGMEQLFAEVVHLIRDAFGYYHVQLFTVDPSTGEPAFQASTSPRIQERGFPPVGGQGLIGWVARTGEQAAINDVAAEPRYRPIEGLEDTRSEAVVPLKIDERLVGILDVASSRVGAFAEEDLYVLQTLADQVAIAIEDNRLYRAERARRRLADTLREVAAALNSTLEPRAVLDLVLTQSLRVIRYEAAAILEWQDGHFCIVAGRGPQYAAPDRCLTAEEDAQLRRLTATPVPFVFGGAGEGRPSSLAAPLLVKDRLIGALILERQGPGSGYGQEEIDAALAFANQAAVAIENARLYEAQQEETWVSTALLQVAESLANLIGVDEVLDAVIRLVPLLVGVDRCLLFLRDESTALLQAVRAHGLAGPAREATLARSFEGLAPNLAQAVQESPAPLGLDALGPPFAEEVHTSLGLRSGVALPLRAGGELVGALVAGQEQPVGPPSRKRRAILTGIANQAAMAIQNAQLYIAQRQEAWVSTALLQVAELAGRTRDLDEILAALVRLTPMLVGVDRCRLYLWDKAQARYLPAQAYGLGAGAAERFRRETYAAGAFPLLDRVRETGELLAVEQVAGSDLVPPAIAAAWDLCCVLALPLRSQAEVLGIMLVDYAHGARHFAEQRVALLTGIANEAAVAIENTQLYRESLERERIAQELQLARRIQATFLPDTPPSMPGWSIACWSEPAREVGGDFYDFITLGHRRLGLVIADVSDKGVPAALFMALSRTVMRAVAAEGHSPVAALGRANGLLLADSRSGMFVTLFYGILDGATGELRFASAGHNPPYRYARREQRTVRLARQGVALGVVENPTFEEGHIVLQPGDALVLYTDGVSDSFDPHERAFGEDGLQAAIRSAAGLPAAQLVAAINQAVQAFVQGAPRYDDYTLLAITRDL